MGGSAAIAAAAATAATPAATAATAAPAGRLLFLDLLEDEIVVSDELGEIGNVDWVAVDFDVGETTVLAEAAVPGCGANVTKIAKDFGWGGTGHGWGGLG